MLTLDPNLPAWVRAQCKRCYKELCLQDWALEVLSAPDEECDGFVVYDMQYHSATMTISSLLKKSSYALGVIYHEFLHLHYAPVCFIVKQVLQIAHENKLNYKQIENLGDKLLEPIIDSLIEKDVGAAGYERA
jgi:hypothetical protein